MITVTDIFAGAGGSSSGMEDIPGVHLALAANHWPLAVAVHADNHQQTEHACVDLHMEDPRNFPRTDILWASPECFAAGTLVLTEHGLIPIEDVNVGDRVLTHKARYQPVTHVMSRRAETVRLVGQGLTKGLEVTREHPILTTTGAGVLDWTPVGDIILDGRTRWATPTDYPAADIPPIGGPRPVHVEDLRFAWLVGRWLGDGSLRVREGGSSETFITCGKHEVAEVERRISWVHHDCGTCAPELTWSKRELRTAFAFANSHSELARWLVEHFGQHSYGKTLPTWALGAPIEWRTALLDGYLSADGHDNGLGWQAASVSKRLALGIRLLAETLGHRAGLTYSHRDTWRIEGRTGRARPQWSVQWLHHINRVTSRTATEFGGHSWGTVNAVEPVSDDVMVYDLTVEDDHSYVADGIVVHNCTKWSIANSQATALSVEMGGDPTLFDDVPDELISEGDDEITRSRLLMFDVLRFIEYHHYRAVVVENVVDVATQPKFGAAWRLWQQGLRRLGYDYRIVSLNSMHAQAHGDPAPQSRDRIYVVAWPEGDRAPDIDSVLRPKAWCPVCEQVIASRQAWKPGRSVGRYRAQYVYACDRGHAVEPGWLPASVAIDWSLEGKRIGDRDKPLSPKTMARIREGLRRYGHQFVIEAGGNQYDAADPKHPQHGNPDSYYRAWPITDPLRTLQTSITKGLVGSLLVPTEGRDGKFAAPDSLPFRTQTTRNEIGLLVPSGGTWHEHAYPATAPLRTVTTRENHGILTTLRGTNAPKPTSDPLDTVAASGNHHGLLVPYYSSSDTAKPTELPIGTLTTVDRYALVMRDNTPRGNAGQMVTPATEPFRTMTAVGANQSILEPTTIEPEDCTFRMLEPHEIALGMSFPADYRWQGSKRERVRLAGNAVTPPAARDLVWAVVEALTGEAA